MTKVLGIVLLTGLLWPAVPILAADTAATGVRIAQAAPRQEIVFACQFDTSDETLGHICRRAGSDALRLAASAQLEMQVAEPNSVSNAVWGHGDGFIQVTLHLVANRPQSQFAEKHIECTLDGRRMPKAVAVRPGEPPDPAVWNVSFEARGVARDLVHPVADAVQQQMASYLQAIAAETR